MYFITICTYNRENIFGNIEKNKIKLSKYGKIAQESLLNIVIKQNKKIRINDYIIMPNHIHFIIELKINNKIKLKDFITTYKSLVTKNINKEKIVKVWQRNYYEHIIRNEKEMYSIQEYIKNNPINWKHDNCYN